MCGICGYYGANASNEVLQIDRIRHRGPDGFGQTAGGPFKFGQTRLAIVDVANGQQPMFNENRTVCLTFNGEIYNHEVLRKGLERRHRFRTRTDTEVILHLFEEEGIEGLKRLDGMFALAIHSPEGLALARDPLGIKPLYYAETEGGIRFASEMKALDSQPGHIEEFPPGCFYREGRTESYYELPAEFDPDLEWAEVLDGIRERLGAAVTKRLMSDVPLGSFLSGGLDSSLITALISKNHENLHTFSVALKESRDRPYADMVAKYLGTIHHEYLLDPDEMWDSLPDVIFHLESFDQSLVRSAVANYFLAKIAADHVKVVLTGEGADEIFAGYDYLEQFHDWNDLHHELIFITANLHNTNLQRVDRMTMAHGLEARVPFLDIQMSEWGLLTPPWFKRTKTVAKWCLRAAYEGTGVLPDAVIHRQKEKFAEGTGVADILAALAHENVSDADFGRASTEGVRIRSKEEFYYYRIFCDIHGKENAALVGRSRS